MELLQKLTILADAAKYDAACTSSGARRGRKEGMSGCTSSSLVGCCHSFSSDGRCVTLLKVLFSNDCSYECKYCVNRRSNDTPRASLPRERENPKLCMSHLPKRYRRVMTEFQSDNPALPGTRA